MPVSDGLPAVQLLPISPVTQRACVGVAFTLRLATEPTQVRVVSEAFDGLNAVKRQRMVYALLADELAGGVHALSLVTKTPAEVA